MDGLATYAATKESFVGIDWANLASGVLKGAGGAFGGGGGQGGGDAAAMEKMRIEQARLAAEQSATTWKYVGIGAVAVIVVGLLLRHKAAA